MKRSPPARPKPKARGRSRSGELRLCLYTAGQTARSVTALANLERICREHLKGGFRIEVIDLLESPELARMDQIVALPTLVRRLPKPVKKIIGDLSNEERVLVGLDLRALGIDADGP